MSLMNLPAGTKVTVDANGSPDSLLSDDGIADIVGFNGNFFRRSQLSGPQLPALEKGVYRVRSDIIGVVDKAMAARRTGRVVETNDFTFVLHEDELAGQVCAPSEPAIVALRRQNERTSGIVLPQLDVMALCGAATSIAQQVASEKLFPLLPFSLIVMDVHYLAREAMRDAYFVAKGAIFDDVMKQKGMQPKYEALSRLEFIHHVMMRFMQEDAERIMLVAA